MLRWFASARWTYFRWVCLGGLLLLSLFLLHFFGQPGWADPKSAGWLGLWVGFLGGLHPVFLHLPIGGLMVVFLMEIVNVFSFGRYRVDTRIPLLFSLGTCLPALWFGYALYLSGGYTGELIERHKLEALLFCALLVICVLFKLALHGFPGWRIVLRFGYGASLLGSVALMTLAGHHGGLITHGDPMEKWPAEVLAQREEAAEALRGDPVVYEHVIHPILVERCAYCHDAEKQEGDLRLDSYFALLQGGEGGPGLVAGDVENSALVARMLLPVKEEKHMPPTDKPQPTPEEISLVQWWVAQGAPEEKKKSELSVPDAIEEALASLVSPAERKAREEAARRERAEQRRRLLAERERLQPLLDVFDKRFPGALGYVSSEAPDLNFTSVSHASSFGPDDLKWLLPFADVLVSADFSRSAIDDRAVDVIAQLTALRALNLSQTEVSDAFIAGLLPLQQLELLNIYGTRVGSGSEALLLQLPALRTLFIGNSEYSAEQTVALRHVLRESREHLVQVVGDDELPELALLTEEGAFAHRVKTMPVVYGRLIGEEAALTLSSNDSRYRPVDGLQGFTQETDPGLEFTFHSENESKPWVQLSFDGPRRISAFILKNRATIPQRAEGLALQRQRHEGSWETIWTSPEALKLWTVDLSKLPGAKRESDTFRFILNAPAESMLHLSHLSLWGQSIERKFADPLELNDLLVRTGQNEWAYVVAPGWGALPGHDSIGATHGGIVVDQSDRVYVSTDGPHGIVVYRRDGTYLGSIAKGLGKYHGLCIHKTDGQEFIYAVANDHMAKYSLDGELVLKIDGPAQAEGQQWQKGTAVAVAPSGEIFIADGYGSSVIFKYSSEGSFLKKFGIRGSEPGQFQVSHGIVVDTRDPEQPLLIVCDRENGRLQLFDLEGNFVRVAKEGLHRPCSVAIWKDLLLVAELQGRAVLLDRDYQVVSVLGENPRTEEHAKFHVHPDAWEPGVFTAPHGCSFDRHGSIYIQEWNRWGRITKLLLESGLTEADVRQFSQAPAESAAALLGSVWLPDQLGGLFLWLDADDASSVTVSSGRVSQWDDKSGKGHHAYALNPNLRPVAGSLRVNGRNALEFFESRLANQKPAPGNWQDVFVVADWNGAAAFDNFNGLLTGFSGRLGIIGDSRGEGKGLYIPETWWKHFRVNGRAHDGSDIMATLSEPFMANVFADAPANVDGFSIGIDRQFVSKNNLRDWEGAVCELIAFERKLSDEERSRIEGYLAHKWGLSIALSENHPYKENAPIIRKNDEGE